MHQLTKELSCTTETSPVAAPRSSQCTFCAPNFIFGEPSTSLAASLSEGNDGQTTNSLSRVMFLSNFFSAVSASSAALCESSIFQFATIRGVDMGASSFRVYPTNSSGQVIRSRGHCVKRRLILQGRPAQFLN